MSDLSGWSYQWSERGGSSYNEYLRSRDIVRSINAGNAAAAAGLAGCMAVSTRHILGSVQNLQDSIASEGDRLARTFTWGFSEIQASLGGMQTTLQDLLKTAKTPSQTAAYEHFEIARDAFRKGLYPECLDALGQAIHGVAGVSAGYKLEWRFHQLRGLILLGSHENPDGQSMNPVEAEACFLMAARYAKANAPKDAARAFLSAGWAAYVQVDRTDSPKLSQSLEHTQRALELDPELGEALFQEAKFQMALGRPAEGLPALRRAAEREILFLAKAAADGDFRRHSGELDRFLEALKQESIQQIQREVGPVAEAIRLLQDDAPALKAHAAAARVLDYALSPATKALLDLRNYHFVQWPKDRKELASLKFGIKRTTVKEWEETVSEEVATEEVQRLEEIVQETYFEEEVKPGGWFRSEKRTRVERTRPTRVVREIPQTKKVQRQVCRRSEATKRFAYNGLGDVLPFDFDSLDIPVVRISPGTFLMGSPAAEQGRRENESLHEVTLTKCFFLAATPCTQRQWETVMGSNPSHFKGADLPVEQVSWDDAVAFCRKLTELHRQMGMLAEGSNWRLPTQAEWEYAARAGTMGPRHRDLDAIAWYETNSGSRTHPVQQKEPNVWGLHDMIGNVWEWCADWYEDDPTTAATDPTGPSSGSNRVDRGGCWFLAAAAAPRFAAAIRQATAATTSASASPSVPRPYGEQASQRARSGRKPDRGEAERTPGRLEPAERGPGARGHRPRSANF